MEGLGLYVNIYVYEFTWGFCEEGGGGWGQAKSITYSFIVSY